MLTQYLQSLGLSDKESAVYMVLAEIGVQPASIIARRAGLDRVTSYKILKRLVDRAFVKVYVRGAVQCFGIESFEVIEAHLKERLQQDQELLHRFPTAMNVLRSLKEGEDLVPRLQIFEGQAGIKSLHRDVLRTITEQKVRQLRILSSNTFAEWLPDDTVPKMIASFLRELQDEGIHIDWLEATGSMLPERIRRVPREDLAQVPMARGATSIFLMGRSVYLVCYKGNQIGLKITQDEIGQIFHFLFDVLGVTERNRE